MPKQGSRAEINTFVKGLVTEASPLNFPANASSDEENFELHKDGTRSRRMGMDLEASYTMRSTPVAAANFGVSGFNTFIWNSVEGDTTREFLVVQAGGQLSFYNLNVTPLSTSGYINSVTLSFPDDRIFSMASVNGKLVAAAGSGTIAVVSFNSSNNTFSAVYSTLKVRDFWGIEVVGYGSETDPSAHNSVAPYAHYYNLRNQSWGIPRRKKLVSGGVTTYPYGDPILNYKNDLGFYPSNSEVVWTGLQYQPIVNVSGVDQDPYERMFTNLYKERFTGGAEAAKGYYIIDVLYRGQSRSNAQYVNEINNPELFVTVGTVPTDFTPGGANIVTEFAGRVFYAGFSGEVQGGDKRSPNLNNYVLFSQLVKNVADIPKCYQAGDPTSREDSDVVETDGGYVRIAGARNIIAMKAMGGSLVVFADNGVWAISGGNNSGFAATNYKVDKISSYGCISQTSVVSEGGQLLFWSNEGIFIIVKSQIGDLEVKSISLGTIQSLYDSISTTAKQKAKGEYDPMNKTVRWFYKEGTAFTSSEVTKELVFDVSIGSFYQYRIGNAPANDLTIMGFFTSSAFKATVGSAEPQSIRYLVIKKVGTALQLCFSYYRDTTFRDWKSLNGVGTDAKAYMLTGAFTAGDSSIAKQIPYLVVHFNRTEDSVGADGVPLNPSSCFMRSQWDWATNLLSKKFGRLVQVYKYKRPMFTSGASSTYDNGFDTIISKNKLRGRGKAISIYFETEPLKDCQLLGWSLTLNGNGVT